MMTHPGAPNVLVACPDARPPAYQAVIGLDRAGLLQTFLTSYYYRDNARISALGRKILPKAYLRVERALRHRHDPEIPADRVRSAWSFDVALQVENRLGGRSPESRRKVAKWRLERFDAALLKRIKRETPGVVFAFSDVGSDRALPYCKKKEIPTVLSMVHGDVREERQVLAKEAEVSPEFFPLYLGGATLDREELERLHDRRLRELELADVVLVPSEHIATTLAKYGTPREKLRVVPYAADSRRFRPLESKTHGDSCTFLFAGGVSQRKGIKYLLEAWKTIRRPGWKLQLLGALPREFGPLEPLLEGVDVVGRVPHAEVPARMAAADVFVFPSLFEGSAVVTYEALACGLPSVVTPSAGSVVRDGEEGFLIPPADVPPLAAAMERLGDDSALRAEMSLKARRRAEEFDWPRYHAGVIAAVRSLRREPAGVA